MRSYAVTFRIEEDLTRGPRAKIRFVRNVCFKGIDYGPDYPKQVVRVPEALAQEFIRQGRARPVAPPGDPDDGS